MVVKIKLLKDFPRVVLPKAVAEAIEFLREEGLSNYDILTLSLYTFLFEEKKLDALKKVRNFHDKELLLKALVNGYQIDESQSTSLESELIQLLLEWDQEPLKKDIETDRAELAKRIVKLLEEREIVKSG